MTMQDAPIEARIADAFGMDDETWNRHANPRSGWSRLTCLPAIVLSLWAFAWIGLWALIPLAAALWWTWANPRIFAPVTSTESWMTRAVLGERAWVNREHKPVPARHERLPKVLTGIAAFGVAVTLWGTIWLNPGVTLLGLVITYLGKLWFADRMVWLWEDMNDARQGARAR